MLIFSPFWKYYQKAAEEEPAVISLVPDNYPVVLPSGESTLSDKIKPEDTEVRKRFNV